MAKLTKKQKVQMEKGNFSKIYPLEEAIQLVQKSSTTNFDGSVDAAVNLGGIDIKNPLHMVRRSVNLPHGTGKVPRIVVICTAEKEAEARDAGADFVGLDDLLKKIEGGWTNFDVMITMPVLMAKIGRLGRILGPKGLIPNMKTGTVTTEIGRVVKEVKLGKISIKTEKLGGIVQSSVGRVSFSVEQLKENVQELTSAILKAKHNTVKGTFVQRVTLSSTMGPSVEVNINSIAS